METLASIAPWAIWLAIIFVAVEVFDKTTDHYDD